MLIANLNSKGLCVIDYGGALGTSYRQNKKFFDILDSSIQWIILEQSRFVQIGKSEFENDELFFINELRQINTEIDLVLLAGSICYFEKPYKELDKILIIAPKFIIITRTPFSDISKDKISLQIVPESIYKASYPIWTFSKDNFTGYLSTKYELIEEWDDNLQADPEANAMGLLFRLIA